MHTPNSRNSYSKPTAAVLRLFQKYFQGPLGFQVFIFGACFCMTFGYFYPMLWIYQSNNAHRSLDKAIEVEKAYKKKKAEEEEAEAAASE